MDEKNCQVCGAPSLEEISDFRTLLRVTSDCAPYRAGGRLLVCSQCGAAQSPADAQWLGEIAEIYDHYRMFHQSGGVDQHVADPVSGEFKTRSSVLVERLSMIPSVPSSGSVIDIGCGTGVMLRALSERGTWKLNGLDLDERNLPLLRSIRGFETLYTCPVAELPGQFEMATMVHSLEHFPAPFSLLQDLRSKITKGGTLFVEVPNAQANPFEYLVADHMVHFNPATLATLVERAGFAVECLATNWVTKELSLVARPAATMVNSTVESHSVAQIESQVEWLRGFVQQARHVSQRATRFGLFGTSIAATWLFEALNGKVDFFVDEDTNRHGRTHLDRPILSPADIGRESVVYIALIPEVARQVAPRLQGLNVNYEMPPETVSVI